MLPYNAAQAFDRISIWVSYLLMIFVGGFILRLLLARAIESDFLSPVQHLEDIAIAGLLPIQWKRGFLNAF